MSDFIIISSVIAAAYAVIVMFEYVKNEVLTPDKEDKKERIVVLGSGWAGYALARNLSSRHSHRVLISPRSHFTFTPLLASTCVGTLEFRTVVEPVRGLGLEEFHQAWASNIDFEKKVIKVEANTRDETVAARAGAVEGGRAKDDSYEVPYDKLIIAVGCYSQTFDIEGVKENACFLRDVGDARVIRLRVLQAFEKAALPTTSDEDRKKLLHFVVVGGGPTGIEFSAELHDLVHNDLVKLYPQLEDHIAITIYDVAPKVLPMFDQNLATYATEVFKRQGITIKTEHHPESLRKEGDHLVLKLKEEEVGAGIVVWSTGLKQNPAVARMQEQNIPELGQIAKDEKTGGIITDTRLRVQCETATGSKITLPDVFALGDCAVVGDAKYPGTASVASQQANYLSRRLKKGIADDDNSPAFNFKNWGTMAYLGGWRAIHQSSADELKGKAAWVLWRTGYLTMSMSVRNKILIPIYWLITWIFGRDISRF